MPKIPVGATIAHAYRFAFSNIFNILGASWLVYVIPVVIFIFAAPYFENVVQAAEAKDFTPLLSAVPLILLGYILFIAISLMPWVAVTEKALGLRPGPIFFYFSLGKPVWRLFGAILLFILMIIAGAFVLGVAGGFVGTILTTIVGPALGEMGKIVLALAFLAGVLFLYGAMIYVTVRFWFLLLPVTIAERRFGLWRSWTLGQGNFWRSFAVLLAIFLPIVIIQTAAMLFILGPIEPLAENAPPEAAILWLATWIEHVLDHWYLIVPVLLLMGMAAIGLICGAESYAYRALVPEEGNKTTI